MNDAHLRHTLERAGLDAADADRMIAELAPAIAAIERERGTVEADLMWALVATQADIWRRQRGRALRKRA
jgi:hypothetical protein